MDDPEEQLSLPGIVRARARRAGRPAVTVVVPAETDPVAEVLVDVPHAHLDRPFDYLVPAALADTALPGTRVKVRFAGQDVDGFIVARRSESEHAARLQPLRRVVSSEVVLLPEIVDLVTQVAARYAGTRADVLRLAVPPRHATAEKRVSVVAAPPEEPAGDPEPESGWSSYSGGAEFLAGLRAGARPRRVWTAGPGEDWPRRYAEAVAAVAATGAGALVCVPDRRDLDRLDAALRAELGPDRHVVLRADAGPAARYAAFLAIARGAVKIVIGTRAAAFAPVHDLALVGIWDDGDDLFAEPRAPYPHTREILLLRAQRGVGLLAGAFARSVEAQYLLRSGWAEELVLPRDQVRARVSAGVAGASARERERDPAGAGARIPHEVFTTIRAGLREGPVLIQTPRQGYLTRLACATCREPAGCAHCHGPLRLTEAGSAPECAWCGRGEPGWRCAHCGGQGLRSPVLGERRTAEELGRAFPETPVRTSASDRILADVPASPALVVATPGAEPVAAGGYAAVILLDTWLMLLRSDLRAGEEALRRWLNAAALVAPGGGARVLAVGDPGVPAVQALVRWDPAGFADREIEDRRSAHLPPASRVATLSAAPADLAGALVDLALPPGAEVLGPVPAEEDPDLARCVIRVPRVAGADLAEALRVLAAQRSARKLAHIRVEIDPIALG